MARKAVGDERAGKLRLVIMRKVTPTRRKVGLTLEINYVLIILSLRGQKVVSCIGPAVSVQ